MPTASPSPPIHCLPIHYSNPLMCRLNPAISPMDTPFITALPSATHGSFRFRHWLNALKERTPMPPATYTVSIDYSDNGSFADVGEKRATDVLQLDWRVGIHTHHA